MRILYQAKVICVNINPEYFFTLHKISTVWHYSYPLFLFDSITGSGITNNSTTVSTSNEKEPVILGSSDGNEDGGGKIKDNDESNANPSGSSDSGSSEDDSSDNDKVLKDL